MGSEPYRTILAPATAELTVERSRFIGRCYQVETENVAKSLVTQIRIEQSSATHNCYAYRVGANQPYMEYYNDHGEPSGTAGKPILGAIQRLNLTNVVVIVTRYFGGKKLGVRGLIEAYGTTASQVLEQAGSILKIPKFTVILTYGYPEHATILHRLQQAAAEIIETNFTEQVTLKLAIPEANRIIFETILKEFPMIRRVETN